MTPNVTTIRPHSNGYGPAHKKRKGYSYFHPAPDGLISEGIVSAYSKSLRSKGSGKSDDGVKARRRKSRNAKGGKESPATDSGQSKNISA